MKRHLALAVTCTAALASIATSQMPDSWEIGAEAAGPALVLTSGAQAAQASAILDLNEAAFANGDAISGSLEVVATACTATDVADAHVRLTVLGSNGQGRIADRVAPPCPDVVELSASAPALGSCTSGPCGDVVRVTFERVGSLDGSVEISWTAFGHARGEGHDSPPAGADLTVRVE